VALVHRCGETFKARPLRGSSQRDDATARVNGSRSRILNSEIVTDGEPRGQRGLPVLSPEIQSAIDASVARAIAQRLPTSRETYLKIKEAGEQLRVHGDTVLRFVHAGSLRAVGTGKLLRIPQSAIAEYLEKNSTAPKAAVTK
jgi:excisionase family DNA binding protein